MLYHRRLSRNSAHRGAMLRNMVDSLFEHERLETTWPKAKEVQRMADKVITLAKRDGEMSRRRAQASFYRPHEQLPKLYGPLRARYADREGGYTRVIRIPSTKPNQAPMAILELVDNPRDIRFTLAARAIAIARLDGVALSKPMAATIIKMKAAQPNIEQELDELADRMTVVEQELRAEHDEVTNRNEATVIAARQNATLEKSTLDQIRARAGYVPSEVISTMKL